ncbi:MAG: hypothetical protein HFI91_05855 [Lachnospiraceae bacterium]|nr:hypothetical protein [Lachnospiraceae bacterium]
MRSARIFLVGMYIHLFLSIVVPIGMILLKDRCWSSVGIGLFLGYLLMIGAVHLTGWISAGMAVSAYRSGEWEMLIKGWKLLKLSSIPFYILNFIYSLLAWIMLIGASRGLLIFLVPIPVFLTCSMIVQSGIYGICVVRYLRRTAKCGAVSGEGRNLSAVHYVLQLVSILDIVSTIMIVKRYGIK